jgi:MFS family permease
MPKLLRVSSLPRIETDRPSHAPLYRSSSAPVCSSSNSPGKSSLHNQNYYGTQDDRSQKLLTNTKKVRGLRSFLWIKPQSTSTQATFVSQLLPSLTANLGSLSIGLALGFYTVFVSWTLQNDVSAGSHAIWTDLPDNVTLSSKQSVSPELGSWIASVFWFGAFLGGVLARWLSHVVGSRVTVIILTLPDLVGWILLASPSSTPLLLVGRLLTGLAAGGYLPTVLSFVTEISCPSHRSLLSLLPLPTAGLGTLLAYSLGLLLTPAHLALLCALVPALLALALTFTSDSPLWLLTLDKEEAAVFALGKLRGGDSASAVSEVLKIQHRMRRFPDPLDFLEGLQTIYRKHMDTFATVNCFFFFMVFSGKLSIDIYAIELFQKAGGDPYEHLSAVIVAFIYVIGCIIFILLGKRFSRKSLYLFSTIICGVFLTFFGLSVYHYNHYVLPSTLVPLVSLSLFMVSAPLGLFSLPFILLTESFPLEVRTLAGGLTLGLASLQLLLTTKLHVTLQVWVGLHGVVWVQAAVCFMAALFSLHLLPRNKEDKLEILTDCDKFAGLRKDRGQAWVIPLNCTGVSSVK